VPAERATPRTQHFGLPRSRKYTLLLVSLVALGLLYPALDFGLGGNLVWTLAAWAVLLGAVQACKRHPFEMLFARWMVIALIVLSTIGFLLSDTRAFAYLYPGILALHIVFFALTMRVILLDVIGSARVTFDTIYGAIALYLLLGVCGAYVLELIHEIDPGAFVDRQGLLQAGDTRTIGTFLYLSFVTLATLGYGDIVPVSSVARLVTSVEAVVGQLYLTILVARLIGLHVAPTRERGSWPH
jgi:hypothetical protein